MDRQPARAGPPSPCEAALTPRVLPSHIVKVRKNLTREVLRAIERAPATARALARAAGISNVLLSQLKRGDFYATTAVAAKLARVLERWGGECLQLAPKVLAAARRVPNLRTRGKS